MFFDVVHVSKWLFFLFFLIYTVVKTNNVNRPDIFTIKSTCKYNTLQIKCIHQNCKIEVIKIYSSDIDLENDFFFLLSHFVIFFYLLENMKYIMNGKLAIVNSCIFKKWKESICEHILFIY